MRPFWKSIQSFVAGNTRKARAAQAPDRAVVALIRGERDRDLLRDIGSRDHLYVHFAETCGEAWNAANRLRSPVILCESDLPGMKWKDTVRILASAISHPCVILTSPVLDAYLGKEIFATGGYDVLETPLRAEEAAKSINLALLHWKRNLRSAGGSLCSGTDASVSVPRTSLKMKSG